MLQQPVYPDIKRQGPRYVRAKKHWTVDAGRAEMQVEHIPQLQEAAVLQQSYSHGSQGAYGKRPTRGELVVNKEFRPPLVGQEDQFPLSRLPRRTIIPNINPSGPEAANQSMVSGEIEGFLTDRVKEGTGPVRYFKPMDAPLDNSVLPDLEFNMPQISASSGRVCVTRTAPDVNEGRVLDERRARISASAGYKGHTSEPERAAEGLELNYTNPQISASSGYRGATQTGQSGMEGVELFYQTPQVSASAGSRSTVQSAYTGNEVEEFEYLNPQVSSAAGYRGRQIDGNAVRTVENAREVFEREKLSGKTSASAGKTTSTSTYEGVEIQPSAVSRTLTDARPKNSYRVPNNTFHRAEGAKKHTEGLKEKTRAMQASKPASSSAFVPRAGISTPQMSGLRGLR